MTHPLSEQFQWIQPEKVSDEHVNSFPELPAMAVQMLHNRGVETQEDVDRFLNPDYGQDQHDPYLFRDMQKAIDRIAQAVDNNEKVVIHGDYDADGVCSAAVMYKTLSAIGLDVTVFLPHREREGYGLHMNTVDAFAEDGVDLIVTVDCGISNKPEIEKAAEYGMDVIVTDHHSEPPELPTKAVAILDAKVEGETYPFEYLAGVGVAFKVSQALIKKYALGEAFEKWLLDLVAISTVTDFVELIGENRVLLTYGLVVLRKTQRPGLRQLMNVSGVEAPKADETSIGFKIGPHINAAGRMGHANDALELVIEEDENAAAEKARNLSQTNKERQKLSAQMSKEALAQAEEQKDEYVIIVHSDGWPAGLVGLVAGKVCSTYGKPTFVISKEGDQPVGSGRSNEHFHLVDALQSMEDVFSKYGGHPMACGFSLKDEAAVEEFTTRMRARAKELLEGKDLRKVLHVEAELPLNEANWDLVDIVEQFAPFGQANREPVFVSRAVVVEQISAVGKDRAHLRMQVSRDGVKRPCIGFGLGSLADTIQEEDLIDIAYAVSVNEWNGNREIQFVLKDIIV